MVPWILAAGRVLVVLAAAVEFDTNDDLPKCGGCIEIGDVIGYGYGGISLPLT